MAVNIEIVRQQIGNLLEGPHWDSKANVLYFVDIIAGVVNRYDPTQNLHTKINVGGEVTPVIPWEGKANQFVVGIGRSISSLIWNGTDDQPGPIDVIASVDEQYSANRFNDGKCDSNGRIWAGTMDTAGGTNGSLYQMDNNLTVSSKVSSVSISNGQAWSSDNTLMYYIDTPTRRVDVFDYVAATGNISNRRTAFDFETAGVVGDPDGMSIDVNDNLWIACYGGKQVIQVSPTEGLLRQIAMPCSNITSVAWGGTQLDELYVTSALVDTEPDSGSLFKITGLGTKGLPANTFVSV